MDAIAAIPLIGGFLSTVLPFVVVLGIVVFVHEFGHYIVARWCGIRSEVFSIGFGPVLWSRRDRRGTLWQVAALPLGGYVKYVGDIDGASRTDAKALDRLSPEERAQSFHGATVGRRMLAVLAGPVFNFLLTIVVFAGIAMWQGVPTERPTIGSIETLPSVEQPLQAGDVVLAVNGSRRHELRGDLRRSRCGCRRRGRCGCGSSATGRWSRSSRPTRCRRWCRASSPCRRRAAPGSARAI